MPDATAPIPPAPATSTSQIVHRLEPVVRGTEGVAALVPSLSVALSRLAPGRATRLDHEPDRPDPSGDGIMVTFAGDTVTAALDITVSTDASVLTTALAVHASASRVLEATHPGRHDVIVHVLGRVPTP